MFVIDLMSRVPVYEQIINQVEEKILIGVLKAGDKMPSVRSLSIELSINPNTIQRAYAELERQGYIYSVKGRGSFVSENGQIRKKKRLDVFVRLGELVEDAKGVGITMLEFQEQVIQRFGSAGKAPGERVAEEGDRI